MRLSTGRTLAFALALIAAVAAMLVWYLWATDNDNTELTEMKAYTADRQEKAARAIVDGLNSRDPQNVDLLRNTSAVPDAELDNAAITENITQAMPQPGCEYYLTSVKDMGEVDASAVPWFTSDRARGFDMQLQQNCHGTQSMSRTIRVTAIPSGMGGYWAEASLTVEH